MVPSITRSSHPIASNSESGDNKVLYLTATTLNRGYPLMTNIYWTRTLSDVNLTARCFFSVDHPIRRRFLIGCIRASCQNRGRTIMSRHRFFSGSDLTDIFVYSSILLRTCWSTFSLGSGSNVCVAQSKQGLPVSDTFTDVPM